MDRNEALAITIQELLGDEPQKVIAQRAGIPESVFSLYKRGRRYPKDGNKTRLAEGLGVTIDQFNEFEWENLRRIRGITSEEEVGDTTRLEMLDDIEKIIDPELRRILTEASNIAASSGSSAYRYQKVTRRLIDYFIERSS